MPSTGGHTAKRGKRGFQPKLTRAQRQELMLCWADNDWKTAIGREFLLHNFEIELSRKGLYNIKQQLKDDWGNRNRDLDEEVDWKDDSAMQELSLISPQNMNLKNYLFGVWGDIKRQVLTLPNPVTNPLPFTYRTIKWVGYMRTYYKEEIPDLLDHLIIASRFTVRDLLADCAKEDMDRTDIDKWLLLQPWSSRENMETYLRLIREKTIPALNEGRVRPKCSDFADAVIQKLWEVSYVYERDSQVAVHSDYESAWKFLLPSQRIPNKTVRKALMSIVCSSGRYGY